MEWMNDPTLLTDLPWLSWAYKVKTNLQDLPGLTCPESFSYLRWPALPPPAKQDASGLPLVLPCSKILLLESLLCRVPPHFLIGTSRRASWNSPSLAGHQCCLLFQHWHTSRYSGRGGVIPKSTQSLTELFIHLPHGSALGAQPRAQEKGGAKPRLPPSSTHHLLP